MAGTEMDMMGQRAEVRQTRIRRGGLAGIFAFLLLLVIMGDAQAKVVDARRNGTGGKSGAPEQRTVRYFESIRTKPCLLVPFLRQMPKGGDLHNHLSGAIYAESFLQWASRSGLCVDTRSLVLSATPCDEGGGRPAASKAMEDGVLYRRMIDAMSMRNSELSGQSGHDHFFDTFEKFGAVTGSDRTGEMLAEAATRAAGGHVDYLELMLTPDGGFSSSLGKKLIWNDDLEKMREELLASGIRQAVDVSRKNLTEAEAKERAILDCGAPGASAGCEVAIRYLFQVARGNSPERVFAQMLAAFELASVEPRVVGLNMVQPEDGYISMRDFSLQMRMLDYLHSLYPKVHIALHAGELAPGLVPPEGLRFHIRESVEKGHAERIGHGVDIMHEDDPFGLLREMQQRGVMVEICLSSNDGILGIRGNRHPLTTYINYGVPVALATDDQGVARSEMSYEYLRAVEEQGLGYLQLKTMARASLEHAFIAGSSLWKDGRKLSPVAACAGDTPGAKTPSIGCGRFLASSDKAWLQWKLEEEFWEFERHF